MNLEEKFALIAQLKVSRGSTGRMRSGESDVFVSKVQEALPSLKRFPKQTLLSGASQLLKFEDQLLTVAKQELTRKEEEDRTKHNNSVTIFKDEEEIVELIQTKKIKQSLPPFSKPENVK